MEGIKTLCAAIFANRVNLSGCRRILRDLRTQSFTDDNSKLLEEIAANGVALRKGLFKMFKITLSLFILFLLNVSIFAQSSPHAEAKWQKYKAGEEGFSIVLPKLPIVIEDTDYKKSEETKSFGAYADGVAYVIKVTSEAKKNPLKKSESVEPFSEKNFTLRTEKAEKEFGQDGKNGEGDVIAGKLKFFRYSGGDKVRHLYFNEKRKRIYEFSIYGANESKAEVKSFFESIGFEKEAAGKEIGDGAATSIGDKLPITQPTIGNIGEGEPIAKTSGSAAENTNPEREKTQKTTPLTIVLQPRAKYTQEARNNSISGTVVLKVVFSASGAISSVTPVKGLGGGLTEQAIAAARKLLFLPKKVGGKPISVVKTVEYGFSIY